MTKSILQLSTVHPSADTRIVRKITAYLAKAGYDVILAMADDPPRDLPPHRFVRLRRPRSRVARCLLGPLSAMGVALRFRPKVIHFHDPELIPVCIFLRLLGFKIIYDVHEDYAGTIQGKYWIPRFASGSIARAMRLVETIGAWVFQAVVVATPTIENMFPAKKTWLVQNYPIVEQGDRQPPANKSKNSTNVTYIGGIAEIRGIKEMLEAVELLVAESVDLRLLLAGKFVPSALQQQMEEHSGWKNVDFRGWCSQGEIRDLLGDSTVGLLTLYPIRNYVYSQPVKLYEYMLAGLPVVASDFPCWREIIDDAQCGLLVDPKKPKEIADAIKWLLGHPEEAAEMGRRGREAVLNKYSWENEFSRLDELYRLLLPAEAGPAPPRVTAHAARRHCFHDARLGK